MNRSLKELCEHFNDLLSSQKIADYCPNGLQVEGNPFVRRMATAVSASLATIKHAVDLKCDALLVHHGLFWRGDNFVIEGVKREKLALLLENQISLIAYHLPLDIHAEVGNNWKAAKDMHWNNLQPFGVMNGIAIGVKGELPSLSREDVKSLLESYYGHKALCAWGGAEVIKTIGLVSGGAHKTILDAAREGLDAFVTGTVDEPVWYQAQEEKINFYALGHSNTERVGPIALKEYINKTLQLPCEFIDVENPF